MEICLLLKFTKKTNKAVQIDAQMMTVNSFLGHWFTDIDIRRYPDDMMLLPTNNSVDIYQYSNAQMKYLPEKSVKKLLKTIFTQISQFTKLSILIGGRIMIRTTIKNQIQI